MICDGLLRAFFMKPMNHKLLSLDLLAIECGMGLQMPEKADASQFWMEIARHESLYHSPYVNHMRNNCVTYSIEARSQINFAHKTESRNYFSS